MQSIHLFTHNELANAKRAREGVRRALLVFPEGQVKPILVFNGVELPITPELEAVLLTPMGDAREFTIGEIEEIVLSASYLAIAGLDKQDVLPDINKVMDHLTLTLVGSDQRIGQSFDGLFTEVAEGEAEQTTLLKRRGKLKYASPYGPANRRR